MRSNVALTARLASALALVLASAQLSGAAPDQRATAPSSNFLFEMTKRNTSHPWLIVTTDSGRFELRVRRLDASGLQGFTGREAASLPPGPISWLHVRQLDEVVTRAPAYRMVGQVALGLAGAGLGNALGAPDQNGGRYALLGALAFGAVGRWLGTAFGDRIRTQRNWYVADTTSRGASDLASTTTTALAIPEGTERAPGRADPGRGESPAVVDSTRVARLALRIRPTDELRVAGDFGLFQGRAGVVGPLGFEQLLPGRRARGTLGRSPADRIPWESVQEVQMRGGSGLRGAAVGGVAFGLLGALLGAAFIEANKPASVSATEGALVGCAYFAPAGAVIGAGTGLLFRRWVTVYRR